MYSSTFKIAMLVGLLDSTSDYARSQDMCLSPTPVTIMNAPSSISCYSRGSLVLGVRACGDWSEAINLVAQEANGNEKEGKLMVMLDGPYGGCSIDIGEYEKLLLIAGGSGVTFTLALLDDLIGRVVRLGSKRGECTNYVHFVWCIRSWGEFTCLSIAFH